MDKINITRLKNVLDYDPSTGSFRWNENAIKQVAGKPAGTIVNSPKYGAYRTIKFEQQLYLASHIAFCLVTGELPVDSVIHLDGDKLNNKWTNLKQVLRFNRCVVQQNNTSGHSGVSFDKTNYFWRANVGFRGKKIRLGWFKSKEDAIAARKDAEFQITTTGRLDGNSN